MKIYVEIETCVCEITKWQMYSQNTTIFISYEWVDYIAVYNYMFWPLSAIVTDSFIYDAFNHQH